MLGKISRIPGPIGCLLLIVLLPVALLAFLVVAVLNTFGIRPWARPRAHQGPPEDEPALASLVQKMALDESFRRDEVAEAAVVAPSGATAEELLDRAVSRGWIEERGELYAVTDKGREAATAAARLHGI